VTDDPGVPDETDDANEDETLRDEDAWTNRGLAFRGSVPSLDAFASIQRYLASIDFSAIQATQRAIEQGARSSKSLRCRTRSPGISRARC
jgi:hypothetical protein